MSNILFSLNSLLTFLYLPLIYFSFFVSSIQPNSEQAILLRIKQQWNNQPPMKSWTANTNTCDWPGIYCTADGSITGISLNSQNIIGEIPTSISELKRLTFLDLGNNNIQENFPTFLYNCSKLKMLNLSFNFFGGELPNDISKLSNNLQHLILSSNNFNGDIPTSLSQLKGLITLYLDSNLFNGSFPSELGTLENLEELVLADNPFPPMRLPTEFGMLKSLKLLLMSQCNLIGEIPNEFANLTRLEKLDLMRNDLVGEIPSGLFLLKNLTYLYLHSNQLSGEISTKINALNLVEIDVSENNLTGVISEDIGNLKKLEILHLFQNQFHGPIPSTIGLLPSLRILKLFKNRFSGTLSPEMGLHSKLEDFQVSNNAFIGHLPENLCTGGVLMGVVAFNNYLNGTIPSSLGKCNSLIAIELYNNSLSGVLSPEIGFLTNLLLMDVSSNQFSGVIPLSLTNCTSLDTLSLHNNRFFGEVPPDLFMLPNITFLFLSDNKFSGDLPSKLSPNLVWLDISNNKFAGQIPFNSLNWSNLVGFQASNNQVWGEIPEELTALSSLSTLLLNGNQLSGELPTRMISWKSLQTLSFAGNNLSGPLPKALGFLPRLQNLDVSNNNLSGQIPPELAQLNLLTLNLSFNSLDGKIPRAFDNMEFNVSFLGNAKLCSDVHISDLPRCSSRNKYLAAIVVPAATIFLLFLCFIFSQVNKGRHIETSSGEQQAWELKPFHKLDFTETTILSGLKDNNMIGSGGSGKVYMIIVNESGDKVAVKRIFNSRKLDGILEKQFLTEIEILGTFRHANIVKLLCCISSADGKLLVYEFMENQSLDRWLCKKRRTSNGSPDPNIIMDWPTRLKVAIGAAKGLCYLHHDCSPPIIHRDVKSSNILLDSEFNAKIADFGLAKMTVTKGEPQTASAVAGSFGYIAPEYFHTRKLNEKIDIYSFGVVLLELATGKDPCKGNNHLNLADWSWQHCCEEHPIIDALDEDIKEICYLAQMVNVFKLGLKCTSKKPCSRPSMKQVLQLLIACNHDEI